MAFLRHVSFDHGRVLAHRMIIGRSPSADIHITNRRVSLEHAVVSWNGSLWELKDLGSRNGSVVDGHRITAGQAVPLGEGSRLRFGAPDEHWVLDSASPPDVLALPVDELSRNTLARLSPNELDGSLPAAADKARGSNRQSSPSPPCRDCIPGEQGYLKFPSGARVFTEDGRTYWLETPEGRREAVDGEVVDIPDGRFRLSIPPLVSAAGSTTTADATLSLAEATLVFRVSQDEEEVQLTLRAIGFEKSFRPRTFDYMLLALARARLEDAEDGNLSHPEQGWVYADVLARSLKLSESRLNVDIYRARRRLSDAGVEGAEFLVERRPATRAVRLGTPAVKIVPY